MNITMHVYIAIDNSLMVVILWFAGRTLASVRTGAACARRRSPTRRRWPNTCASTAARNPTSANSVSSVSPSRAISTGTWGSTPPPPDLVHLLHLALHHVLHLVLHLVLLLFLHLWMMIVHYGSIKSPSFQSVPCSCRRRKTTEQTKKKFTINE